MNWFSGCSNEADIKARYRDLAKRHHPDLGGDTVTMQSINAAYEDALKGAYRAAGMDEQKVSDRWERDAEAAEMAARVMAIDPGLVVELCGCWLWITGATRERRAELKAAGCFWAPKKSAWYWRREVDGMRWRGRRRRLSLEEIRWKYGSARFAGASGRGGRRDDDDTAGARMPAAAIA